MPEGDPQSIHREPADDQRWRPALPGFLLLPGEGLLLVDHEYRITWHNAAWLEHLELAEVDLIGESLASIWPALAGDLERLAGSLGQGPIDRRLPHPLGGAAQASEGLPVRLFQTDGGFGIGRPGIQTTDTSVDPSIHLLCTLLNTVNEALLVTLGQPLDSPGPIIIFANSRLAAYNGYDRDQILGRSPRMFQGPESDRQQLHRFREGLKEWRHDLSMEIINYRRNGEPHWAEISAAPLRNTQGEYQGWVAVQRNITDRKTLEKQLLDQASTDPLTGALNRRGLKDRMAMMTAPDLEGLGVIYADVDHLKRFNDAHGHGDGDLLLLEIIRRIRSVLRDNDLLARVGGDEFVVVLPKLQGADHARRLAERLQVAMRDPWLHRGLPVQLSLSMGVALMNSANVTGRDAEALLQLADQAMYQAKASGRRAIHVAVPESGEPCSS